MRIRYVDGDRFRKAVLAGAEGILHTRDHLNRINVFPVPDGDTGTNMALSLSAIAGALRDSRDRNLDRVSRAVAEASVLGAKGNSGTILAHWFLGMAQGLSGNARIGSSELARAMTDATDAVYGALDDPVEGTILTTMRAASDAAQKASDAGQDVLGLLDEVTAAAHEALAQTPDLLPVLREAKVVDAGAQGFVNFLDGVRNQILGKPSPGLSEEVLHEAIVHPKGDHGDLAERFCTEVVVRGGGYHPERLRSRFSGLGSSLLVAATPTLFKLHIHTNHPEEVFRIAGRLGTIEERKVDDMSLQSRDSAVGGIAPIVSLDQQGETVAIVCDSTGDLPEEVRQELGIEIVPLQILFGDEVFRDQVDLSTDEFYRKLRDEGGSPTTSQPPPRAFVEALERIRADREVVVLAISGKLSGTVRSAKSGIALMPERRVELFDSRSASLGLGMLAMNAARLARRGASVDEILRWLRAWREETGIVFTVATLEYLRRGGRVNVAQSLIGNLFDMRPVLSLINEEVRSVARGRGDADARTKLVSELRERLPEGARIRLGMVGDMDNETVKYVEQRMRKQCEVVEILRGKFTGVVGAHTGPGTWGVVHQRVTDDDPLLTDR
ncbi:MAG: DegV family protein [Gemmatimonadota bacterium]|jgi:hypothetical protein|nr:hypothetical protein [Gemmatimonadota bacterium]MDP6529463.1 DegV family protein [Gemmatimonadota bacterium]